MRTRRLSLLILLSVLASGCGLGGKFIRTMVVEPGQYRTRKDGVVARYRCRRLAVSAWQRFRQSSPVAAYSEHYASGFKKGFTEYVYAGGPGTPPPIPPRRYWNDRFQTPQGHREVNDWYAGYRSGVAIAMWEGCRNVMTVPSAYSTAPVAHVAAQPQVEKRPAAELPAPEEPGAEVPAPEQPAAAQSEDTVLKLGDIEEPPVGEAAPAELPAASEKRTSEPAPAPVPVPAPRPAAPAAPEPAPEDGVSVESELKFDSLTAVASLVCVPSLAEQEVQCPDHVSERSSVRQSTYLFVDRPSVSVRILRIVSDSDTQSCIR